MTISLLGLFGCNSATTAMPTMQNVDLEAFCGEWFVIAHIPTPFETDAFNAVEHYACGANKRIKTTFSYNKGSFTGDRKSYQSTGIVSEASNAVWGMQFIWPFQSEYLIAYTDADYQVAIIGRSKRDYVWLMARSPDMGAEKYARLMARIEALGYDLSNIRRVPHDT